MKPQVAVIMGSDSDFPVMAPAVELLESFGVAVEVEVVSAHRTPERMQTYAKRARSRGIEILIAGAGGAAHLPGMVASLTTLPVIGVPVQVGKLKGLDALLSIAQMPKGVPVATMAVDNAFNAGLLAARILSLRSRRLLKHLVRFDREQKSKVAAANRRLSQNRKKTVTK